MNDNAFLPLHPSQNASSASAVCWGALLCSLCCARSGNLADVQTPARSAFDHAQITTAAWDQLSLQPCIEEMTGMHATVHHPFIHFGLLTTKDLERMFNVSDDTITRAYKRGDL